MTAHSPTYTRLSGRPEPPRGVQKTGSARLPSDIRFCRVVLVR